MAVERRNGTAVLEIADDGPGLPVGERDHLFDRFVRGEGPADVSADSGAGLGLAIVKAVASSHGGDVEAGSSRAGGARFTGETPAEARPRGLEEHLQIPLGTVYQRVLGFIPDETTRPSRTPRHRPRRVIIGQTSRLSQLGPPVSPSLSRRVLLFPERPSPGTRLEAVGERGEAPVYLHLVADRGLVSAGVVRDVIGDQGVAAAGKPSPTV